MDVEVEEETTQAVPRSSLLASGQSNPAKPGLGGHFSSPQSQRTRLNVRWPEAKRTPGARRVRKKRRSALLGRGEQRDGEKILNPYRPLVPRTLGSALSWAVFWPPQLVYECPWGGPYTTPSPAAGPDADQGEGDRTCSSRHKRTVSNLLPEERGGLGLSNPEREALGKGLSLTSTSAQQIRKPAGISRFPLREILKALAIAKSNRKLRWKKRINKSLF